jgi:excisionase family DNA binding protein
VGVDLQEIIDAFADAVADRLAERMQPIKESKPARNPPPMAAPEWVTTKQAAKALNCSYQFLEKLRTQGGGPDFSKVGASVRYRREDLDTFMAARKQKNTAKVKR